MFLIAGYARYACPYVWVRSNHHRLIRLGDDADLNQRDYPLKLKSTTEWYNSGMLNLFFPLSFAILTPLWPLKLECCWIDAVQLWDIVAELVEICTSPLPRNPFAIDITYFEGLAPAPAAIASGAMIHFLQRILNSGSRRFDSQRKCGQVGRAKRVSLLLRKDQSEGFPLVPPTNPESEICSGRGHQQSLALALSTSGHITRGRIKLRFMSIVSGV